MKIAEAAIEFNKNKMGESIVIGMKKELKKLYLKLV